jgi:hypothetical protein
VRPRHSTGRPPREVGTRPSDLAILSDVCRAFSIALASSRALAVSLLALSLTTTQRINAADVDYVIGLFP